MGSIDIVNAKHRERQSLRETLSDGFLATLVVMGNFRNRIMNPRLEGTRMPWSKRVAQFAGRAVINPIDIGLGDRFPGLLVGSWSEARVPLGLLSVDRSSIVEDATPVVGSLVQLRARIEVLRSSGQLDSAPDGSNSTAQGSGYNQTSWTGHGSPTEMPDHPYGGVADVDVSVEVMRQLGHGVETLQASDGQQGMRAE